VHKHIPSVAPLHRDTVECNSVSLASDGAGIHTLLKDDIHDIHSYKII